MNIKKIVAALAAAAVAVTMTAFSAFAAVIELDTDYPGAWSAGKAIPKSEFAAIGGDVKVVLTVQTKKPLVGQANYLAKPMNNCVAGWPTVMFDGLTSDTAVSKADGYFVFAEGQTTLEFVVPEAVWSALVPYEGDDASASLGFQVSDVIIKSAELSAGSAQGEIRVLANDDMSQDIMAGKSYEEVMGLTTEEAPAEEEAATEEAPAEEAVEEEAATEEAATEEAPAEEAVEEAAVEEEVAVEEAPAADNNTTAAATGNAPIAAMVAVMALAGAGAIVSKKRN